MTKTLAVGCTAGLLMLAAARPASASGILVHEYDLNGSLADNFGGPSLASNGGTLGASGYTFAANQGLSLSSGISPTDYSIVLNFSFTDNSGYRKIVDFKNLTSDLGLYTFNSDLDFYNFISGPAGAVPVNTEVQVTLTRDGATGGVRAYVGTTLWFSFTDSTGAGTFTGPNNIVDFFSDDVVTGTEASGGFANEIRIYNGALTADQVGLIPPPNGGQAAVPEPSTLTLCALGAVGIVRKFWLTRRQ